MPTRRLPVLLPQARFAEQVVLVLQVVPAEQAATVPAALLERGLPVEEQEVLLPVLLQAAKAQVRDWQILGPAVVPTG